MFSRQTLTGLLMFQTTIDKVNVGAAAGGVYMGMSRPFAEVEQEQ